MFLLRGFAVSQTGVRNLIVSFKLVIIGTLLKSLHKPDNGSSDPRS